MQKITICDFQSEIGEFVRVSELIEARRSLLHFKLNLEKKIPRKESRAMRLGTMVHMACLEPEKFKTSYAPPIDPTGPESMEDLKAYLKVRGVQPKGRTKAELIAQVKEVEPDFKSVEDQIKDWTMDRELVNQDDWDLVLGAKRSFDEHPVLKKLCVPSKMVTEERIFSRWTLPNGAGGYLTGSPDLVLPEQKMILELKRTFVVSSEAFMRNVFDRGYHLQAAAYREMVSAARGEQYTFAWVAIEAEPPHAISLFVPDEAVLDRKSVV